MYRSLKTKGLLIDVEHLPPAENAFAAHQRVRVAIDRLHNTENVHAMSQQVCALPFWFLSFLVRLLLGFTEKSLCFGKHKVETSQCMAGEVSVLHHIRSVLLQACFITCVSHFS